VQGISAESKNLEELLGRMTFLTSYFVVALNVSWSFCWLKVFFELAALVATASRIIFQYQHVKFKEYTQTTPKP